MERLGEREVVDFLTKAEIEVLGLLPYASNATLLTKVGDGSREGLAVYKPRRGERPLWDFPTGTLCLREYAAYVVSRDLGWDLVPPTVLRDGPAGFGALQLFVDADEEADVRQIIRRHTDELRRIALFDAVINNADRKAGHLIIDPDGKVWGVDHGVCFSDEPKLRTVVWAFEAEPIEPELLTDLEMYAGQPTGLEDVLDRDEIDAMKARIDVLLRTKRFPSPDPDRHHVPWPPW